MKATQTQPAGARRRGWILVALTALLVLPAINASPASATPLKTFVFSSEIGSLGSGAGHFRFPSGVFRTTAGVAVNYATGHLYVADTNNQRVDEFDPSMPPGEQFIRAWGWGVLNGTAEFQTCTKATGCKAGILGSKPGQLENPVMLAVDNSCYLHKPAPLTGPACESFDPSYGDVYVVSGNYGDPHPLVTKFSSTGELVASWGDSSLNGAAPQGQTDGSAGIAKATGDLTEGSTEITNVHTTKGKFISPDVIHGPGIGPDATIQEVGTETLRMDSAAQFSTVGAEITGGAIFSHVEGVAVDSFGNLFITADQVGYPYGRYNYKYDQSGNLLEEYVNFGCGPGMGVDSTNTIRCVATDPVFDDVYNGFFGTEGSIRVESLTDGSAELFGLGKVHAAEYVYPAEIAVRPSEGTKPGLVYVANDGTSTISVFEDFRRIGPKATTDRPTELAVGTATLSGEVEPNGHGPITDCYIEYGLNTKYGQTAPCDPDPSSANFTEPTPVTATLTGLTPTNELPFGTKYHYRFAAQNAAGAIDGGKDESFNLAPPRVEGVTSSHLAAITADLEGAINPEGLPTTYFFEYGTTPDYGQVTPEVEITGSVEELLESHPLKFHLTNLASGAVYHYRFVSANAIGTTTTEDRTFNFYPTNCPNQNVRQQTQANYLPDCRAYELVSPGDAGGTQLFPGGPNTGEATSPSRFSFTGLWSTIPNSGGSPIDGSGDLYVATREPTGWVTKYVGLPSSEVAISGGPPMGLPNSAEGPRGVDGGEGFRGGGASFLTPPTKIQNGVLTDPGMNNFLAFIDGTVGSNAPYLVSAGGEIQRRLPTNLATVPDGVHSHLNRKGEVELVSPGGSHSLDCFSVPKGAPFAGRTDNYCPGDVTASADLSHLVFASEWNVFALGGSDVSPGSVYDDDIAAETVTVVSKTPAGTDIPNEPQDLAEDALQIPFVSEGGSHILMASTVTTMCVPAASCGYGCSPSYACGKDPICSAPFQIAARCPLTASRLYMRVSDAVTYDVSQGHIVRYVGATPDGSLVYFISTDQISLEDTDTSADLYAWSEKTNSISLISIGDNGEGNSDACEASFATKCGAESYSDKSFCSIDGGLGGNCRSDSFIADNGDIYFFSPEQLDGNRGLKDKENLYVYRSGEVEYVTTFTAGPFCQKEVASPGCTDTGAARMEVTPDNKFMAFVTSNPVTQYDNAGHLEMYRYATATKKLICVSCIPGGAPPTSDVNASQDGLFLTNDGRAFFSTEDALVHGDTNRALDVYEYVDGRPQLITLGTGETRQARSDPFTAGTPGFVGVSADGTDVYFSTYDTLVPQDHNGLFLKFYDARTGGGFSAPAPPKSCEAADECHGPSSQPPLQKRDGTGAVLPGGNLAVGNHKKHQKKKHQKKRHHKRRHHAHRRVKDLRGEG